MKKNMIKKFSF